jgi:PAS domain S-box-containing protein
MFIEIVISLGALLIGVLLLLLRRQKAIGFASTIAYAACLIIGSSSRILLLRVKDDLFLSILVIIVSFVILYLPALVFTYSLGYSTQNQRSIYRNFILLAIFPVLVISAFASQLIPGLLPSGSEFQEYSSLASTGVWGWLISIYSLGILIAALTLMISRSGYNLKSIRTEPLLPVGIAILLALVLILVSFSALSLSMDRVDLMLIGFTLIGAALLVTNLRIPRINLITREELFDSITDGIIILNNEDEILDLNPAAEQLIGIPTQRARGNLIEKILTNWNSISGLHEAREIEFRGSINLNQQWRHISVRINRLQEDRGKVIILRDMTARKGTEEARQHAREDMFNLLRSFFKSANTSQSSNDLFRDVLFQIAYTFRADSGAICLVESAQDARKFKFSVMAKHGPLVKDNEALTYLHDAVEASRWILGEKEPLIVSEAGKDQYFGKLPDEFKNNSIAVFPLLYNEQLLGVLMLARAEAAGFLSDEIIRLGVVTEELASFIDSDRRRKADIALAERQHLVQDLHDSTAQKLAGLLKLAEAVRLGVRSGAPVDEKRIDRIIETARQALREMRLFIFELAPVDIEKDGLVSTLQQRLAAVEGRSDMQPRMIADSEIILTAAEETEIYYIVEEALNNILKHANAKTVLVTLKRRKKSLYLEIVDDGLGFDPVKVETGGRGLGNMKLRAKRINATLKITSSYENGTKITMVVPQ